jgi:hypothetical protein
MLHAKRCCQRSCRCIAAIVQLRIPLAYTEGLHTNEAHGLADMFCYSYRLMCLGAMREYLISLNLNTPGQQCVNLISKTFQI